MASLPFRSIESQLAHLLRDCHPVNGAASALLSTSPHYHHTQSHHQHHRPAHDFLFLLHYYHNHRHHHSRPLTLEHSPALNHLPLGPRSPGGTLFLPPLNQLPPGPRPRSRQGSGSRAQQSQALTLLALDPSSFFVATNHCQPGLSGSLRW